MPLGKLAAAVELRRWHAQKCMPARQRALVPTASQDRSYALTGLRPAGHRRIRDATACLCSEVVARLINMRQMSERMPGKQRTRCMRHLYTILQWISQRIAETVRNHPEQCRLEQSWVRLSRPPASFARNLVTTDSSGATPPPGSCDCSLWAVACVSAAAGRRTRMRRACPPTQRRPAVTCTSCAARFGTSSAATRPDRTWCDPSRRPLQCVHAGGAFARGMAARAPEALTHSAREQMSPGLCVAKQSTLRSCLCVFP
jgi:hypothetical protein